MQSSLTRVVGGIGVRRYSKSCFVNVKSVRSKEIKPNANKQRISKEILEYFDSSGFAAVYHYNDVNCKDWKRIQNKLVKHTIKLKVVPTKLTAKILSSTQYRNITPLFRGSTVIAFGKASNDVSHLLTTTKKENKLKIMGGMVDNQLFTPMGMQDCAKLQTLEMQHIQLTSTLTSVQSHLSKCLMTSQQHLCSQLGRIYETK